MKKIIYLSFIFAAYFLQADEVSRQRYHELIKQYPHLITPKGDSTLGEIEIIVDPQQMALIEKTLKRDVGVVKEDGRWIWINDVCKFPGGKEGIYGRIYWKHGLQSPIYQGVVAMPITAEGKIVLNCNYRHATRSWEIELPRGVAKDGETIEAAAKREVAEETGREIENIRLLGDVAMATSESNMIVPVFVANVISTGIQKQEEHEAIEKILELSVEDVKKAFSRGYYECKVHGIQQQVPFRDPFLAYALIRFSE
jgi:ADP-ribose pyrophosphatase